MPSLAAILLWLFVIDLGVAFGAGIYEHRIVVARWIRSSETGTRFDAAAAREDDPGRRFWGMVTTLPLTALTVASLVVGWSASGALRRWWLAAGAFALADRVLTFGYFIPTMIGLMRAEGAPGSGATATRWRRMNYLRLAL